MTFCHKAGGLCKAGNAVISAEVFTPDGSIADGEILDNKNGTYDFLYTVPKEGDFCLAVRLYDQHIKGSPFRLRVTPPCSPEDSQVGLYVLNVYVYITLL